MRTRTPLVVLATLAFVAAFALVLGGPRVGPPLEVTYPDGCRHLGLSDRRCAAIVKAAGELAEVDPARATSIRLVLGPACPSGIDDGCVRSRQPFVLVRFAFADGTTAEQGESCYGVTSSLSLRCTEQPEILLVGGVDHDIPCGPACTTPVPTINPAVLPDARPLEVAELDIPLSHTGHYEISLGTAVLANGVLVDAAFELAETRQVGFLLDGSAIQLMVRDPDGRELRNVYATGWKPGTVKVSVSLAFDIVAANPGTVLHVRNVVIR